MSSDQSDEDHQRSTRSRPSVSSKCLFNLKTIVTHNVSSNNQNKRLSHSENIISSESSPSSMKPIMIVKEKQSRKSLGSMVKKDQLSFDENQLNFIPSSAPIDPLPTSVLEKFAAMTVTKSKTESSRSHQHHRHSHQPSSSTQGKAMTSSRDIPIPIFRHDLPSSPVVTEHQHPQSRVFVNSSFTPPAMPSNFTRYTRLPPALRNQSIATPPLPNSYQPQMPFHSRRSFPQTNRPRTPNQKSYPISREYHDCCDSPSTSSNSNSDITTADVNRRRTSGRHYHSSVTTMEQNLIDAEERSLYFRQVSQTQEIMKNVVKRFREDLDPSIDFPLVDTHCHFDLIFERMNTKHNDITRYFQDYKEYYPEGLLFELAIQVFWRPKHLTEDNWVNWYSKYLDDQRVYAACGIHPHWSSAWNDTCIDDLERCLQHPKVVAIGEIGLDFGPKNQCKTHVQTRAFEAQLKLAAKWNKPIVIHSREAYPKTFKLMKEYLSADHKIHLHCFVGNLDDVDLFTSYFTEIKFGFTPLVSRSSFLHPVLQQLELSQILCETDSPYFIPDELSNLSRSAHPGMVYSVIETIGNLRNLPLIDVARQLRENARHIYGV